MSKLRIVTVDDDLDILDVLELTLEDEFEVIKAMSVAEGIKVIKSYRPDMAILDYILPDGEGIDICIELRRDPFFIHLPILMLTGKGEVDDKVKGLNAGADDYMVKPFAPNELIARVNMLIRRSTVSLDANPLSRLPGNISINNELNKRMQTKEKFAVLYFDLDNFKALNDYYGFERGDKIIKDFAQILINSMQKKGTSKDFIGHIGGDDFVAITSLDNAENIAKEIIANLDKTSPTYYNEEDRIKGYIETEDRSGSLKKFPFLTVSIAIITNQNRNFSHIAEIGSMEAELKEYLKKTAKSNYVIDRRSSSSEKLPEQQ